MPMRALAWCLASLELEEQESWWSCCPVLRERLAALISLRGLQARFAEALQPEYPPVRARFAEALQPGYPPVRARFAASVPPTVALPAAGPAMLAWRPRALAPCYRSLRAMLERAPERARCPVSAGRLTAPANRQALRGQSAGAWQRNPRMPALVPGQSAAVLT
jgi:hypothetical protein